MSVPWKPSFRSGMRKFLGTGLFQCFRLEWRLSLERTLPLDVANLCMRLKKGTRRHEAIEGRECGRVRTWNQKWTETNPPGEALSPVRCEGSAGTLVCNR